MRHYIFLLSVREPLMAANTESTKMYKCPLSVELDLIILNRIYQDVIGMSQRTATFLLPSRVVRNTNLAFKLNGN